MDNEANAYTAVNDFKTRGMSLRLRAEAEHHQAQQHRHDHQENESSQSIQALQDEIEIQRIQLRMQNDELDRLNDTIHRTHKQWDVDAIGEVIDSLGGIFWTAEFGSLRMKHVSNQAERILGYPVSDWIGQDRFWLDHIHPKDREAVMEHFRTESSRKSGHRLVYRMSAADGRTVWIEDRVGLIRNDGKPSELYGLMVDVTEFVEIKTRLDVEREVLELIARGASLKESLSALALAIERHQCDIRCSILLTDNELGVLRHGAAPSLPEEYVRAVDGVPIADSIGSCCTAAFRRQLIVVEDIAEDPKWADYKDVALRYSLRACWSSPILDVLGNVLGTFAIYKDKPGRPTAEHLRLIELATHIAVIAICKDRTETSLRTSERELRLVLDNGPGFVSRVDLDLRYRYVNDHYVREFGRPRESVLGRRISDVIGSELFAQCEHFYKQALDGKSVTFESSAITTSGVKKYWLVKLVPELDAHSSVIGFFVMGLDVTARKQANEQRDETVRLLKKIAGEIPGFVYQFRLRSDGTSCFPYVSERVREIFGVTPSELVDDSSKIFELHHPDDRERIMASIADSSIHLTPWSQEFRLRFPDGNVRWVQGNAIPERDPDGSTLWHGYLCDITDRKRAEASGIELEKRLRESQKLEAIGTLAGGIAHDFNNILTIILGNAEIGRMDLLNGNEGAAERCFEEINKAGQRARDLVRQIISFSRKEPSRLKPMDLALVVEESVRLLRATLPSRLTIDATIDANTPDVEADGNLIQQVILNLATNAMQAMEGKQGILQIRWESVMSDDKSLCDQPAIHALRSRSSGPIGRLIVRDNGCGMDGMTLNRIFEPFFTTKEVGKGTGLGMAVVHGIVRSHGGEILIDSEPNVGTTFTICFPTVAKRLATDAGGGSSQHIIRSPSDDSIQSRPTVMVVDDDLAVLRSIHSLLDSFGCRVYAHSNQQEAMEMLRRDPSIFDLILIDYNMPGVSGTEVAEEVKSIRDSLPIVLMSGFIDDYLVKAANSLGVQRVLQKPCLRSELLTAVVSSSLRHCKSLLEVKV